MCSANKLALLFLEFPLQLFLIYDIRVRVVVSVFNETVHSFFVWGSLGASVALLCCCHCKVGCIVYTDYVYPAFVLLLTDIACLLFLFRKYCVFSLFSPSFSPYILSFFILGLLAFLVSLPD